MNEQELEGLQTIYDNFIKFGIISTLCAWEAEFGVESDWDSPEADGFVVANGFIYDRDYYNTL